MIFPIFQKIFFESGSVLPANFASFALCQLPGSNYDSDPKPWARKNSSIHYLFYVSITTRTITQNNFQAWYCSLQYLYKVQPCCVPENEYSLEDRDNPLKMFPLQS